MFDPGNNTFGLSVGGGQVQSRYMLCTCDLIVVYVVGISAIVLCGQSLSLLSDCTSIFYNATRLFHNSSPDCTLHAAITHMITVS